MDPMKQSGAAAKGGTCPQCGAALPAGALAGLCPACLLKQGAAADSGTHSHPAPFAPPEVAEIARLFPQLEILELIGKGGMGAVYKARQPALDRLVALKVLPTRADAGADFAERFNREARALARLNHPSIVAVHEFGQVGGLHFFIMEYVDGTTLRQLERNGRLSPRQALAIVPAICDALQYAHDEGVVHRDIKPENVLIDRRGRVKIADFGLARILAPEPDAARLTGEGQVMGTPHYMAPEQIEHPLDVDHRADIFALGVVFYEMLTGELPLGRFPPPSRRVQIDVRLDDVVLRALEKEPERRYQHASEVKTAVETVAHTPGAGPAGTPPAAPVATPLAPATGRQPFTLVGVRDGRRVIHWPAVILFAALVAVAVLVAVTVFSAYLLGTPLSAVRLSTAGWLALLTAAIAVPLVVQWLRHLPTEQLPQLDRPDRALPCAAAAAAVSEELLRQVRRPAMGLFAVGVANWVLIPLVVIPFAWFGLRWQAMPPLNPGGAVGLLLAPVVLSGVVFVAALRMMRLQSYGLAIAAAILAMIVTPGNLIGFPIGIWALVVLLRPEVRAAFDTGRPLPPQTRATAPHGGNGGKTALIILAVAMVVPTAVLVLVTVAGMLTAILMPALSRGGDRQRQAVVRASGAQPAPAYIHSVRVQRDRADINGQGTGDYSLVLEIGAPGAATTWTAGLGQGPLTAFDAVLAPVAPDWTRLQFAVTRRGGGVAQYIDLPSVRGLPRGRVVFRTGNPSAEADGSYVVADLVPESGPALPISVYVRPTREIATVAAATPGFGPVIEKVIGIEDADSQGLVFLDLETGQTRRPPFALKLLPSQGPAFVEITPELRQWIEANDPDILLHLGEKSWDRMTLEMQEDFAGQLPEWETVSPAEVVAVFAAKDAAGLVRDRVPASSFGHSYSEGFGSFSAFRTRGNSMGVYQFEGMANSTRRGVNLRYKLALPPAAALPEAQ